MNDITIKITIFEGEFKDWVEFEEGGRPLVKKELKSDFIKVLRSLGIYEAEIEID